MLLQVGSPHSVGWDGAKAKWALVRHAHFAVFALRRTFNKRPKKEDARPRCVGRVMLLVDAWALRVIV